MKPRVPLLIALVLFVALAFSGCGGTPMVALSLGGELTPYEEAVARALVSVYPPRAENEEDSSSSGDDSSDAASRPDSGLADQSSPENAEPDEDTAPEDACAIAAGWDYDGDGIITKVDYDIYPGTTEEFLEFLYTVCGLDDESAHALIKGEAQLTIESLAPPPPPEAPAAPTLTTPAVSLTARSADGQAQLEDFAWLMKQHPALAVVRLSTPDIAADILALAKDTPVLFFGVEPPDQVLAAAQSAWYVGYNAPLRGELAGEQAAVLYWNKAIADPNGDLLISTYIVSDPVDTAAPLAADGMTRALENSGVFLTPLGSYTPDTLPPLDPTGELVLCTGPAAAVEVLQAMATGGPWAGAALPVVCAGCDADCAALIQSGGLLGGVLESPSDTARALCTLSQNLLSGHHPLLGGGFGLVENGKVFLVPQWIGPDTVNNAISAFLPFTNNQEET